MFTNMCALKLLYKSKESGLFDKVGIEKLNAHSLYIGKNILELSVN